MSETKATKLSDSQLAVLHCMIDGWELKRWIGDRPRLHRGKAERTRTVHRSTLASLITQGLLRSQGPGLPAIYGLTPAGRKAAKATP